MFKIIGNDEKLMYFLWESAEEWVRCKLHMITWYVLYLCKEPYKYLRCKDNGSLGHMGTTSGKLPGNGINWTWKIAQVTYFHSFTSRNTLNFKNYFWLPVPNGIYLWWVLFVTPENTFDEKISLLKASISHGFYFQECF